MRAHFRLDKLCGHLAPASTAGTEVTAVVANGPKSDACVKTFGSLAELPRADPQGDVVVKVEYSTVNYKDGLVLTGAKGVTKGFPLVAGIDLSGVVTETGSAAFRPGDKVVLTGNYIGQHFDGGLSSFAKVRSSWLLPLPPAMSTRTAMVIGTAGFTAMQCILQIEDMMGTSAKGDLLITGAGGGVGATAIRILRHRGTGFRVVASSGRDALRPWLLELGADEVIGRVAPEKKPMVKERWAACIDAVGGETLASVIPAMQGQGVVTCCGNAGGAAVSTTVLPFILRGVKVCGIDSVSTISLELRQRIWAELGRLPEHVFSPLVSEEVGLAEVPAVAQKILKGQVQGRCLVRI